MIEEERWNLSFLKLLCYIIERHTLATSIHPVVPTVKRTSCDQQKVARNGCNYKENSQNTEKQEGLSPSSTP